MSLEITVNGEPRTIPPGTTVARLLEDLGVTPRHCAVEVNLELVPRARQAQHELAAGDQLEVVTLVGGG
ncbi:MAG: sulfur carrier protein ThiS [Pirellulales bacterium]|nr:sulfur carrier protein ThiS [Pirellulales bacterium]